MSIKKKKERLRLLKEQHQYLVFGNNDAEAHKLSVKIKKLKNEINDDIAHSKNKREYCH